MRADWQYRELCRLGVAEHFGIPLDAVQTRRIPAPVRRGQERYDLAIDLVWVTETPLARYIHIGGTFFRRNGSPVELANVLLLQQCKDRIGAHKVVLFTDAGFSAKARAAAQGEGVSLFIVRPLFDPAIVRSWRASLFQQKLQELAATVHPLCWM